ncbi:hypothetical protein F4806DRAFT_502967 [Annulohypoxylon nitens]|nr:hypothetical protein F4806DRAFT_502967 [Annulohypoxylon nitens]
MPSNPTGISCGSREDASGAKCFTRERLEKCKWRPRGWTLQELLAPENIEFYDAAWEFIATKDSWRLRPLSDIIRINTVCLRNGSDLGPADRDTHAVGFLTLFAWTTQPGHASSCLTSMDVSRHICYASLRVCWVSRTKTKFFGYIRLHVNGLELITVCWLKTPAGKGDSPPEPPSAHCGFAIEGEDGWDRLKIMLLVKAIANRAVQEGIVPSLLPDPKLPSPHDKMIAPLGSMGLDGIGQHNDV